MQSMEFRLNLQTKSYENFIKTSRFKLRLSRMLGNPTWVESSIEMNSRLLLKKMRKKLFLRRRLRRREQLCLI